jgi:hypothetical protein
LRRDGWEVERERERELDPRFALQHVCIWRACLKLESGMVDLGGRKTSLIFLLIMVKGMLLIRVGLACAE